VVGASTEIPGRKLDQRDGLARDRAERRAARSWIVRGDRAALRGEMIEQAEEERQVGRVDARLVHRQDEAPAGVSTSQFEFDTPSAMPLAETSSPTSYCAISAARSAADSVV
jgi:hypothetical protein